MVRRLLPRFVFGAGASVGAGLVSLRFGEIAGGLFLAFPAILPATLTLLERNKGTVAAVGDARGAVAGALGLIAFAGVVVVLGDRVAGAVVLVAALAAWIATSSALLGAGVALARLLRLRQYPPEVPVSLAEPLVRLLRERGLTLLTVDGAAGGALGAMLSEVRNSDDVIRGSITASTPATACQLIGVPASEISAPLGRLAEIAACAARARWSVDIVAALLSRRRDHPVRGEAYELAVATPSGVATHRFTAHRGREGNWGEAVLLSVRFVCSVIQHVDDVPG